MWRNRSANERGNDEYGKETVEHSTLSNRHCANIASYDTLYACGFFNQPIVDTDHHHPPSRFHLIQTPGIPKKALTAGTPLGKKYTSHNPVNATASPVNFSNQV
jgi:hypothetical protein